MNSSRSGRGNFFLKRVRELERDREGEEEEEAGHT